MRTNEEKEQVIELNNSIEKELLAIEKKENTLANQMNNLQRKLKELFEYREGIRQLDLQCHIACVNPDNELWIEELNKGAKILFPVVDKGYRYKFSKEIDNI